MPNGRERGKPEYCKYGVFSVFGKKYLIKFMGWETNGFPIAKAYDVIGKRPRWGTTLRKGEKFASDAMERVVRSDLAAAKALIRAIDKATGNGDKTDSLPGGRLIYTPIGMGFGAEAFKEQIIKYFVLDDLLGYAQDELQFLGKLGHHKYPRYPYFADFKASPESICRN